MIRTLLIIIAAGVVTSLVCVSGAMMIAGPEVAKHTHWSWTGESHDFGPWRGVTVNTGDGVDRAFAWSGGDRLEVNAPADVTYVQAAGPAKLTIHGPTALLDAIRVSGGKITLDGPTVHSGGLRIQLQAPDVSHFALDGVGKLDISGYKQDGLDINLSGHGKVTASGEAKSVKLDISGAGQADLSKVKTLGADLDISGAGQITAAPTQWAKVHIAGVGDVNLLTRPPKLETDISGAGRIRQSDGSDDRGAKDDDDDDDDGGPKRST